MTFDLILAAVAALQIGLVAAAFSPRDSLECLLAWLICLVPVLFAWMKRRIDNRMVAEASSNPTIPSTTIANWARSVLFRSSWVAGAALAAFLASGRSLGIPFWLTIIVGYQALLARQVRTDLSRLNPSVVTPPAVGTTDL